MSKWLLRGLVFATAMVILRLFQGVLINASPQNAILFSSTLVALFAIAVFFWVSSTAAPTPARTPTRIVVTISR